MDLNLECTFKKKKKKKLLLLFFISSFFFFFLGGGRVGNDGCFLLIMFTV